MSSPGRSPEDKQKLLSALQRKSGATIAQFFVAHGLGQAYESAGAKNSKSAKIAAAMIAAEKREMDGEVYESLRAFLGSGSMPVVSLTEPVQDFVAPQLPAVGLEFANTEDANHSTGAALIGAPPERLGRTDGLAGVDSKGIVFTRSGRVRKLLGGLLLLAGISVITAAIIEPPGYESENIGWSIIAGTSIATVGALLFAQTMRHRGSLLWRTAAWTAIPGLFVSVCAFASYGFLVDSSAQILQTGYLALSCFGLFWTLVGPFFVYQFIKEAERAAILQAEASGSVSSAQKEKGLTVAEILIISATTLQAVTTLIAPLYGK